ncbi:ATP-binding protein [Streptomyces sparsogenes]|uniref:ATP-binding protein n=1 Tax=Streptomyces sparsogenes TaxID=67365 RepID=UPI0033CAC0F2
MTSRPAPVDDSTRWRFPRHPRSVGRARQHLRQALAARPITPDVLETAELLLSELVTNAVQHARVAPGREIEVRYELSGSHLRIEVADASDEQPQQHTADDNDERGRGLLLVEHLAAKWGVSPRNIVGKSVWFELSLPSKPESEQNHYRP